MEKKYAIVNKGDIKALISDDYNYIYDRLTGRFARWGKTKDDDPAYCPFGPEIADIEITTSCNGIPLPSGHRRVCAFCYKSNTPNGTYMSFDTFKTIFHKLPETITQIAFGIDAQAITNPDMDKIFRYCKQHKVVPNVTVADLTDERAKFLADTCGAVAVSRYANKDVCYNTIEKLGIFGLKQVNMHIMLSKETKDNLMETMKDYKTDRRLKNLNAIVILSLKKKGRGEVYNPVSQEEFTEIVSYALDNNIPIGFDSCSAPKFMKSVQGHPMEKVFLTMSEPCESGLFSMYIDVEGVWHPCSFMADTNSWKNGINMLEVKDFNKDVWYHPDVVKWRENLISIGRKCPEFEV